MKNISNLVLLLMVFIFASMQFFKAFAANERDFRVGSEAIYEPIFMGGYGEKSPVSLVTLPSDNDRIEFMKLEHNFRINRTSRITLVPDNSREDYEDQFGNILSFVVDVPEEGMNFEPIRINISELNLDVGENIPLSPLYEISVADNAQNLPIFIEIINPQLSDFINSQLRLFPQYFEGIALLNGIFPSAFGLISTAYAQDLGWREIKTKKGFVIEGPIEMREVNYGWRSGPKIGRYPDVYETPIPLYLDAERKGGYFKLDIPDEFSKDPLIRQAASTIRVRLEQLSKSSSKNKEVEGEPAIREVIDENVDYDCVCLWYDKHASASCVNDRRLVGLSGYKKYPLYQICGFRAMEKMIGRSNMKSFFDDLVNALITSWKYYSGLEIATNPAMPFLKSDSFDFETYPINPLNGPINITFKPIKSMSGDEFNMISVDGSVSPNIKIELALESLDANFNSGRFSEEAMGLAGNIMMRTFVRWVIYKNLGIVKVREWEQNTDWEDIVAGYSMKQVNSKFWWDSIVPGSGMDGAYSFLNGNIHFLKDPMFSLFRPPKDYAVTEGNNAMSAYLSSVDDPKNYIKTEVLSGRFDVFKGNVPDCEILGQNPTALEMMNCNRGLAKDFLRFARNIVGCKLFTPFATGIFPESPLVPSTLLSASLRDPSVIYAPGTNFKIFNGKRVARDGFGLVTQEYPAGEEYRFYSWLGCVPLTQTAEMTSGGIGFFVNSYRDEGNFSHVLTFDLGRMYGLNYRHLPNSVIDGKMVIRGEPTPVNVFLGMEGVEKTNVYLWKDNKEIPEGYIVDWDRPIGGFRLLPYSIVRGDIELFDERKSLTLTTEAGEEKRQVISLYFYYDDDSKEASNVYEQYINKFLRNIFVIVQITYIDGTNIYREYNIADLDNDDDVKLVSLSAPGEVSRGMDNMPIVKNASVKLLQIGIAPNNGVNKGIPRFLRWAIVNGNREGTLPNLSISKDMTCSPTVFNVCTKYGAVCDPNLLKCVGIKGRQDTLMLYARMEIENVEKCSSDEEITRSGECGCKIDGNDGFGKENHHVYVRNGAKLCIPNCKGDEYWDSKNNVCVPCVEGQYNAFFDADKPASDLSFCKSCTTNTKTLWKDGTKSCDSESAARSFTCRASCGCSDTTNFVLAQSSKGELMCQAKCPLGSRFDGTKCVDCNFTQTSSEDRLKCEECNQGITFEQFKPPHNQYKHFFTESRPGCDYVDSRCGYQSYYDKTVRGCRACPTDSDRVKTSGEVYACACNKFMASTVYVSGNMICPTSCSGTQYLSLDGTKCETCPMGQVRDWRDNKRCRDCPAGGYLEGTECRCPKFAVFDTLNWKCTCPDGTYNVENRECKCGANANMSYKGLATITYPNGYQYNTYAFKCECPVGSRISADLSKCDGTAICKTGQVFLNLRCYWPVAYSACTMVLDATGKWVAYNQQCKEPMGWHEKCSYSSYIKHYCPSNYPFIEDNCSSIGSPPGGEVCCLAKSGVSSSVADYKLVYTGPYANDVYCCPKGTTTVKDILGVKVCE